MRETLRRPIVGYAIAVLGVSLVTAVAGPFAGRLSDTTVALVYLLVVLLVAAQWGSRPAFVASVVATLAFNFFFLPPLYELTIADPRNWVALVAFLVTAVIAGQLSQRARRRTAEAEAAREAARRAEAYDRSLLEASLDAMVAIGHDGRITDVNAAAQRLTGRSRAELIGSEFASCFTDPRRASADHHQALYDEVVRNSTLAIHHRDGRAIPVLSNASAYRDERGEIGGVFVVARELETPAAHVPHRVVERESSGSLHLEHPAVRVERAAGAASEPAVGRLLLALLPPIAIAAIQYAVWPFLRPFAWFFFLPGIYVSTRIGRLRGGVIATMLSGALAWWLFVPPEQLWLKGEPRYVFSGLAFAVAGVLLSVLQDRAYRATRAADAALAESRAGAERMRRASEEIAKLVEQASDGIFVADRDGRISEVNLAGSQLVGYAREQLVGQPIGDLLAPDDAARFRRASEELRGGGVQIAEYRLRRKEAPDLPVEVSAKILPDGRWQAFVRDITERKHAELALRESEAKLHRAQEIAQVGSWYLDVVRDRLAWSDEVYRIFEIPIGMPMTYELFLARVHPDDRSKVERAWTAALGGAPYDLEHRIVVDGSYKWVHERAEVERHRGAVIAGIGTVQDITARKRGELELARLNRAYHALSRSNQALVRANDPADLLTEICRTAVEEAGYRFCWVGRAEHDDAKTVRPIARYGHEDGYLDRAHITWADTERGRGPTGTAIREHRVVSSKDIANDPALAPWRADALRRGYLSSITIPLDLDPSTAGALTIYAGEVDAFGDEAVALLDEFARDLSFGLAALHTRGELRVLNAELEQRVATRTAELRAAREREAEIGGRIQRELLLDRPPREVRGLEVAAVTIPSARIAGDFYGFFHHEANDCLDAIIADVMGKDVPAALLAAATKGNFPEALWHLMAGSAGYELPEPKDIVTLAHRRMASHLIGLESFVTACYARFDVGHRAITLVDCGHTGLVVARAGSDTCEIVHGQDLPLGVREGEIYDQLVVPFSIGDVAVLFSDGVTDARDDQGEFFGIERLVACVRQHVASGPAAVVEGVRAAVTMFAGSRALADDMTCVVVRMIPHELPRAHATLELRSELCELRRAREAVTTFCSTLSPPPTEETTAALALAIDEAASNVIKHAYGGREDQQIQLRLEAFEDRVAARLRYLGAPFDPSLVPAPALDGSRESGFGVYLIAHSVDRVRYYRDDLERSCIHFEKHR